MKLKKKEYQNVDASVLLTRESKILKGGNTESMCRTETEGKDTQEFLTWGSIPYTVPKPRIYGEFQNVLACWLLIYMSLRGSARA